MNIKEILFWIFLIISVILVFWYILGNTPNEFIAIITIVFMVILKLWIISDRQIKLEAKFNMLNNTVKNSFYMIKKDMALIKRKLKI